jgi:hypothetical protein
VPVPAAPPADNEYLDLTPGSHLSVTVPYFKSGRYVAPTGSETEDKGVVTMSAPDLIGVQVSHFAVEGRADQRVRLLFLSADTTRDGKKTTEEHAPALPFALPKGYRHVRLVYFVRSSQADHNMAITASKTMPDMNEFTNRMRADPSICEKPGPVSCVWVPPGIAVRAE